MERQKPLADAKTVAEKLECYCNTERPGRCTNRGCPYNNNDPEIGYWCCSNRLIYDAVTLLYEAGGGAE
jgi:hypothetical protein